MCVVSPLRPAFAAPQSQGVVGENPHKQQQRTDTVAGTGPKSQPPQQPEQEVTTAPVHENAETSSSDTTESSEDETESTDEDDNEDNVDASAAAVPPVALLNCTNPRFLLDGNKWPSLVARFSDLELGNSLRAYYHEVATTTPHEMKFIVDILLTFAGTLRAISSDKEMNTAKTCLVAGVTRSIGRLEFYRARILSGNTAAATLESTLLDESLPKAIRKARREGKTQSRREEKENTKQKPASTAGQRKKKGAPPAKNFKKGF